MASYGFNFRASSGYVTDPAGTTYAFANNFATDTYPDAAISSALGVNAGWYATSGMESFNQSTGADARLAGFQRLHADNEVNGFRVDITAGDADIRLAVGAQTYASPDAKAEAFDNATTRGVLVDQAGGVTANNFRDATDTLRSLAAWPGSNAAARVSIASGICIVKFGRGSGGSNRMFVAHMAVEEASGGGGGSELLPKLQLHGAFL
jgi:hypothetical protein